MELFEEIRRGHSAGKTIQGLAKKHGVHRSRPFHIVGSGQGILSSADLRTVTINGAAFEHPMKQRPAPEALFFASLETLIAAERGS